MVKECDEVKGIQVLGTVVKLSRYEDDMTVTIDMNLESLSKLMHIFNWFKQEFKFWHLQRKNKGY